MNCWNLQFGVEGNIGGDLGLFIELWRSVATWLVRSSPDQVVQVLVQEATLHCVLEQDTLLSQCLSLPWCINGYW